MLVGLVLAAALAGFIALFAVQNSSRVTQLSLDLGMAAWQLTQPVSVPALMGICIGGGFLLGVALIFPSYSRLSRRARSLEQKLALTEPTGSDWR
jgi:uncharacterized integral membrane protein